MSTVVRQKAYIHTIGVNDIRAGEGRAGIGMRAPGSEQGRRGASRVMLTIREHAGTVVGERSSSPMGIAIKRPRTRSTAARQVSSAYKRDLVTNQNV